MAITVKFYQNLSDNRCMDKELIPLGRELTCDVYDTEEVVDPVLTIDNTGFDMANINYCEIPEFGRKYFITSIAPREAKKLDIACHVDVLSTYAEDIRNCPLIAARSTNLPNYYLHDDMRIFNSYVLNQYIDIGNDIGEPEILNVITVGKGSTGK